MQIISIFHKILKVLLFVFCTILLFVVVASLWRNFMFQFSLDLKKIALEIFRQNVISGLAQLSNPIFSKVSFHAQWGDTAHHSFDDDFIRWEPDGR